MHVLFFPENFLLSVSFRNNLNINSTNSDKYIAEVTIPGHYRVDFLSVEHFMNPKIRTWAYILSAS